MKCRGFGWGAAWAGVLLAGAGCVCLTNGNDGDGWGDWRPLWDGATTNGWVRARDLGPFPDHGWEMKDGTLTVLPCAYVDEAGRWRALPKELAARGGGGDVCTAETFADFDLMLEFRLTPKANSGIKYYFDPAVNNGTTLEYQILDPGHPDSRNGRDGNRRVAALYDMMPAHADALLKPCGEWNEARLVARGTRVEHWLNGRKVLAYERGGAEFAAAFATSKYRGKDFDRNGKWGLAPTGRILLQDHTDSTVSYRNIRVRTPRHGMWLER